MNDKYTLTLDASAINAYGKCPLMWAYINRENLALAAADTEAMDKGTLVHQILEIYYKLRAKYPNENRMVLTGRTIDIFRRHEFTTKMGFPKDMETFITKRFTQYIMWWEDRDLIPAMNNGIPGVELGFSKVLYEDDKVLFVVEGKIDLVNQINHDAIAITDHKSQDRESHYYNFRPQMLTYAWAAEADYAILNYFGLQKELTKNSFRRDTMHIPLWMRQRWEFFMLTIFQEIAAKDHLWRNTENEFKFERNLTSCAGPFETHPCQYTKLCEISSDEMRAQVKHFAYKKREEWRPWKLDKEEIEVTL